MKSNGCYEYDITIIIVSIVMIITTIIIKMIGVISLKKRITKCNESDE